MDELSIGKPTDYLNSSSESDSDQGSIEDELPSLTVERESEPEQELDEPSTEQELDEPSTQQGDNATKNLSTDESSVETRHLGTPTMSRWLSPNAGRTDVEAAGMAVAVKKEDREKLTPDALLKLQRTSTEGMTHKFGLMGNSKEDQLVQCYNLALRIEELKLFMKKTDIIAGLDVFETTVAAPLAAGATFPVPMPRELSLFDTAGELLPEDRVRDMMRFKRYYGRPYDIQDLQWGQELLENSCDEDLRIKVLERLRKFPDVEQGSALYFYVMVRLIQTDVEHAARGLLLRLEKMTLRSLSGENIFTACSLIQGVLDRLRSIRKCPDDIDKTILTIMQTSSVDDFNDVFRTLSHNNLLDVGVKKTPEEILGLAERVYKLHLDPENPSGPWKGAGRVGKSTFITAAEMSANAAEADGEGQFADQTCWKCGGKGHISRFCPGGGRGGGGGGRGGKSRGWRRIPPGAGESDTKIIVGVNWYWCATCTFWNTTHKTPAHVSKGAGQANQANLADDDTASTASSSGAGSSVAESTGGSTISTKAEPTDKSRVSFYGQVLGKMKAGKD